jgi:sec-independent protein translocase protein TatA
MNLGLPELIVIAAVALLVFGPKRLPELAKGLGKGIRDFKKALEGKEEETLSSQKTEAPGQPSEAQGTEKK